MRFNYSDIMRLSASDRKGHLHPSSAGKCWNSQLFEAYGVYADHSEELQQIFALGHKIHAQVQTAWSNANIIHAVEQEVVWPEYHISGHADGIGVINGSQFVLEIKSASKSSFLNYVPYQSHIEQVQLYMHILGIKSALLLYINKEYVSYGIDLSLLPLKLYFDGQWFKIIHVRYDVAKIMERINIYNQIVDKFNNFCVFDHIKYDFSKQECKSCGYAWHCIERLKETNNAY